MSCGTPSAEARPPMPPARIRRTETSITRHPLRYACSRAHHAGYEVVETQWPDGEGGFYRAYRCSNCEATWVEQHINAEQPHARFCTPGPLELGTEGIDGFLEVAQAIARHADAFLGRHDLAL
jgi:hypothetical protein